MLVDKIIQIDRSHRRVLLAAMAVIASVGLYRWILAPYNSQLMAAQRYESALDGAIGKAGVLGTTLKEKKTRIEELTKESERCRNEVFTSNEAQEFFASLQNTVNRAGCVLQSVTSVPGSQNQAPDASGISQRKAVVTVIGGYGGIVDFLGKLQTFQTKVWIDSVKMETGTGTLKCQVALTIYCIERMETN